MYVLATAKHQLEGHLEEVEDVVAVHQSLHQLMTQHSITTKNQNSQFLTNTLILLR